MDFFRPVVDEENDYPLIMSKIKLDPPEMPLEELEEIDRLSKGKLRHLLSGSPSGFAWDEESEKRIRWVVGLPAVLMNLNE